MIVKIELLVCVIQEIYVSAKIIQLLSLATVKAVIATIEVGINAIVMIEVVNVTDKQLVRVITELYVTVFII